MARAPRNTKRKAERPPGKRSSTALDHRDRNASTMAHAKPCNRPIRKGYENTIRMHARHMISPGMIAATAVSHVRAQQGERTAHAVCTSGTTEQG
jgi:hypothetical protein